jgi:hypothetical protein
MPENLNLSLSCGGKTVSGGRSQQKLTKESMVAWIKKKKYAQPVEELLLKKVQKYPDDALPHFRSNIQQHVENAIKSLK